jgi:GMP synthase-like glutamine amidotransferase
MKHKIVALPDRVAIIFPGKASALPYPQYITQVQSFTSKKGDVVSIFYAENNELPNKEPFDRYVITGSPHSVHEEAEWLDALKDLLKTIIYTGNYDSMIAICFGHQLIAELMGGAVTKDTDWSIQIKPYRHAARVLPLFACHSQKVSLQPPRSITFLQHPTDHYAGLMYPRHRIITVQAHPESSLERIQELLRPGYNDTLTQRFPVSYPAAIALNFDHTKMNASNRSLTLYKDPTMAWNAITRTLPPRMTFRFISKIPENMRTDCLN